MDEHGDVVQMLQPVFDSCDFNGDGFVKIEDLLQLGKQHAFENIDELEPLLKQLDPNGDGKITFQDFCQRVKEITIGENEHPPDSPILVEPRARSYTDSEGFFDDPDSPTHSTSSTNDYYGDLDDLVSPSRDLVNHNNNNNTEVRSKGKDYLSIYSTYPLHGMHKRKNKHRSIFQNNHLLGRTSEHQSKEEGFEGVGEASDADETMSVHSDYSTPEKSHSYYHRRVSGSAVARRLRMVQSAHCSLQNSTEELRLPIHLDNSPHSDSECNMIALASQIEALSGQVSSLQIDQENHREKQMRSKSDNRKLLERITILEEQLHEARSETNQKVEEVNQKYTSALARVQRDHEKNLEQIQLDLRTAQTKIAELNATEPMLRKELEMCLEDRRFAQLKIDELNDLLSERDRMLEDLRHRIRLKNEELERLRNDKLQEIAALTDELESLRYQQKDFSLQYDEKNELLKEIGRLKMENDKLKNSKDDLRDQLLQHKTFFDQQKQASLADELLSADKEEVLKVLKKQETANHRMQQYIDMLLMLIMESNPELLEKM